MEAIQASTKRKAIPKTARAGREMAAHTSAESPKDAALQPYQAKQESASLNQNGTTK